MVHNLNCPTRAWWLVAGFLCKVRGAGWMWSIINLQGWWLIA
jgi:hypothetical protein